MAALCNTFLVLTFFSLFLISTVLSSVEAYDFKYTICSRTTNPYVCLNLKHVQTSSNVEGLTRASIEVALAKANGIHANLNSLYKTEKDELSSDIYLQCSKNYNDAIRDLTLANRGLDSRRSRIVLVQTNDAEEEVKACRTVFNGARRDPANIKKANEEFYLLSQVARESSVELVRK